MTKPTGAEMKNGPWTVHSTEMRYENPWIMVEHHEVTHPSGMPGIYGVIRFKSKAVGILPIDETGHVWLVGQHRYPFDRHSWELPEGGVPHNEDPLDGAKRELREETGLTATNWQALASFDISNSVTDETAICYLAYDLTPGETKPDPSEDLEVRRITFTDLYAQVMCGKITDSLTVIMTLMAYQKALQGTLPRAICDLILPAQTE